MDDELEIDLRKLIRSLLRRWMWIVGLGLIMGLVAFAFTYFRPRLYEAKAVIALTRPPYQPNFDSRYQTLSPITLNNKMVTDIALGDELLGQILSMLGSDREINLEQLKERVEVESGSDTNIVILSVRMDTAEEAADIVNAWGDLVAERINTIYSGRDESQVRFFEQQIELAKERLTTAGKALEEFEKRNESAVLTNQRSSLLALQNEALRRQRTINVINRDTELFIEQLNSLPPSTPLTAYEQTNLFLIYSRIYADTLTPLSPASSDSQVIISQSNPSSQLLLSVPEITEAVDRQTAIEMVGNWLTTLNQQSSETDALIEQTKNQIEDLQHRIQILENEKQRLELEWTTASETYTTLSRKYDELRVSASDSSGFARVASYAKMPQQPMSRGLVRNTALGVIVGLFVSIFGVLVWDWWRGEETSVAQEKVSVKESLAAAKR